MAARRATRAIRRGRVPDLLSLRDTPEDFVRYKFSRESLTGINELAMNLLKRTPPSELIHRTSWNRYSRKFACTELWAVPAEVSDYQKLDSTNISLSNTPPLD